MANTSNPFEILFVKIWVNAKSTPTNIPNNSSVKTPTTFVNMKNQNEIPAVTANDLKRGDEACILNWINKRNQTCL